MDPLTHLSLTALFIGRNRAILAAGVLPDLPFYILYSPWVLSRGALSNAIQTGDWPAAPAWMQRSHHMAHSFPMLLGAALFVRLGTGRWPRWALAWALHILIDIPTHSRQHWAPRFLWPISTITVDGVSWLLNLIGFIQRLRK